MPTKSNTPLRVLAMLRERKWSTANELSKDLHLHSGTVRGHLHRLVASGAAERRVDPDVPGPRGAGADRFNALDTPWPPKPTTQKLCDRCIDSEFGDQLRYRAGLRLTGTVHDYDWPDDVEIEDLEAYQATIPCDRCNGRLYTA